jgi:uncharacterized Zn finger protein
MNAKKKLNTDKVADELAFFQEPTSTQVDKPAKPHVDKYTTHLTPATIREIKKYAFEHEMKDYEVVQEALDSFFQARGR